MDRETLLDLGLTEEQAEAVADALAAALEGYVPKSLYEQAEENHAAALRAMRLDQAIRDALSDAHDTAIAAGLIDRDALALEEDGSVSGLQEQIELLKDNKPFLFRDRETSGFTLGADPRTGFTGSGGSIPMREVIAGRFQAQRG